MLHISYSPEFSAEKHYVVSIVFKEFLGLDFTWDTKVKNDYIITCKGDLSLKKLVIEDYYFCKLVRLKLSVHVFFKQNLKWVSPEFLFNNKFLPLPELYKVPILFPPNLDFVDNNDYHFKLDIFGSIFFMLSRHEEIHSNECDKHGRFPSRSSLSIMHRFHEIPIVDLYTDILWYKLKTLWPQLERKKSIFQVIPTHDVDQPFETYGKSLFSTTKTFLGDVFKRKSIELALKRIRRWKKNKSNILNDRYFNFSKIMKLNERYGLKSQFFFLVDSPTKYESGYSLLDWWVLPLLHEIHERGHKIGLHASYATFNNFTKLLAEFLTLKAFCTKNRICQNIWYGRQHYLRWSAKTEWVNYSKAGINIDSSVGFHDQAGFRCGTCRSFSVFDSLKRIPLNLIEQPLIIMDGALLRENPTEDECRTAYNKAFKLKQLCRYFGGNLVILWHNTRLTTPLERELYEQILKA